MNLDPQRVMRLRLQKEGDSLYRRRRHADWTENYTLYRDKVLVNRLLQRQSVNIPLIKYSVKTLLKDIDDAPMLYFTNLSNDEQKEVYYNEYWKFTAERNKLIVKDVVDKRQVLLFGRSFKVMNMMNGMFTWEIGDPQDFLVNRYVDPANIDTARNITRQHIYKPLSSLTTNPVWNTDSVRRLQRFFASQAGLIKAEENQLDFVEKQARMMQMGVIDTMNPILGETYVELNEHIFYEYNPELGEDELIYAVTAEDMEELFVAPLEVVIGETRDHFWRNHYPISTWADETERTDFWSDGVADTLRTLNKILNAWFSQLVENRTLRSFGMNLYNASLGEEGFSPQTWQPRPWGWYGIPAGQRKLDEAFMHVDIPELKDSIEEMNFIIGIAEKASAATTFQQGVQQGNQVTLGEVKMLLSNAQERVKSMAVYYTDSWKDFGLKYIKMLEAAPHRLDQQQIHRHGRLSKKMYTKVIGPDHWQDKLGYTCEVKMKSEALQESMDSLQWINGARSLMPNNQPLDTIYKKKMLENSDLTSDEIGEVLKYDKQMQDAMAQAAQQQQGQIAQTRAPSTSINYKDIGNNATSGQAQLANQAGIKIGQQQPQQGNQLALPANSQPASPIQMPQLPQPQAVAQ